MKTPHKRQPARATKRRTGWSWWSNHNIATPQRRPRLVVFIQYSAVRVLSEFLTRTKAIKPSIGYFQRLFSIGSSPVLADNVTTPWARTGVGAGYLTRKTFWKLMWEVCLTIRWLCFRRSMRTTLARYRRKPSLTDSTRISQEKLDLSPSFRRKND